MQMERIRCLSSHLRLIGKQVKSGRKQKALDFGIEHVYHNNRTYILFGGIFHDADGKARRAHGRGEV